MDYSIAVHFKGEHKPRKVEFLSTASEILARIPVLLQDHAECEHVVVMTGLTRLFSVDCKGNRSP